MKKILNQLFEHEKLTKSQAKEVLIAISENKYNEAQVASFISVYLMRGITVEELAGFREALLELCVKIDLGTRDAIDVCGTGGDGKNTFNISTLSAFVVAGAGYKVIKHGNYGSTSVCGSSNVLEHLGYVFSNNQGALRRQLEKTNICFLHAPMFHPALKGVAHVRRQLGVKTFFNMLGPLVNPAQPLYQMVGVFNLKIARIYQYLFQDLDKKYAIVHALDGYDEVSLTGDVKVISNDVEAVYKPSDFESEKLNPDEIYGGDTIEEASGIFVRILKNEATAAQKAVVLANSAIAIQCFDMDKPLIDCLAEAEYSLLSGKAFAALNGLIAESKGDN